MSNVFHRFARGFLTNLKTIIQAIVFSIVIWVFISIQIFPDVSLHITNIPVSCQPTNFMIDENLRINSVDTQSVTIQINGKRYSISQLTANDFSAVCDLSKVYEAGTYDVPINIVPTGDNSDVSITSKDLTAKISVVKIVTREVKVVPNTDSLVIADGMQIEGDVTVSPTFMTVTGEESLVNSIDHVEAIAAYGDGVLDHSEVLSASPTFFNSKGIKIASPDVIYSTEEFAVNVPVYKLKTLPIQVKFTGSAGSYGFDPADLQYTMSIDEITIASPDSSIDNLSAIDIGEISLSALTLKDLQGGVQLPVELPEGYKNISGNKTITVTFPEADDFGQLGFTVPSENYTVINSPTKYSVKMLTNEIVVNVVGYSNYIQTMTSSDIYATINLLGMDVSEGKKSVTVTFRLKGSNARAWVTGEEYKVDILIVANEETEASETLPAEAE
ncbi:MAG: hypothetical protein IJU82_00290 [Ruminiclostridium sp.]|nr:hypothetical protein [Ruminiclostridium sp.]